ncbi:Manganese/iron superoxide dismutase [Lophiotrema nucula]|uniref:Manganese/iron superoxide dismutase n=1 Tax=Lophiotrema nucula TaxID=690887 RepID=A0A6A5YPV6_9PLEO|nr:Manganese/iron superoxide dismutase [Lophiotrema nucula]
MIVRSLARRPNLAQSLASLASVSARCLAPPAARRNYTVPSLANNDDLKENGVPGLFSAAGFNTAYTGYMKWVIGQLNEVTAGQPEQNLSTGDLTIKWARDPIMAHGFNCASMAFNNHFFFSGINTDPNIESAPSDALRARINADFSSLQGLEDEFLATSEAMFGPGFIWLVQTQDRHALRILPTYLAGSPLSGAHYRKQSHDLNTHNARSYEGLNTAGAFGANSEVARKEATKDKKPLGGVDITPLLCVNTWEHVWLHDYGIGNKRKYLEQWWRRINWNKVEQLFTPDSSQRSQQVSQNNFLAR